MTRTTVVRSIQAPVETVFDTIAHIENFKKAVPHILRTEFLSEQRTGVGTRFLETRDMNGKEATVELEVTEYVPHERVRIVSDTHGTVWDAVFTVKPTPGGRAELTMVMDAKAYKFLPKLVNPLIKGMIQKHVEKDMDLVKAYCEQRS